MPKARNYQAEYAARKARATRRGLTSAEARGHADVSKGHVPIWLRNAIERVNAGKKPSASAIRRFREMDAEERIEVMAGVKQAGLFKPKDEHMFWSALLGS